MKALTVKQPWAWAIIHAKRKRKDIENRTWNTEFRGTFAVHAGKTVIPETEFPKGSSKPKDIDLARGAIIGVVDLIEVVDESDSSWFSGPFGYVLSNPRPLQSPIEAKGSLGFWNIPESIERKIENQLGIHTKAKRKSKAIPRKKKATRKTACKDRNRAATITPYEQNALNEVHAWKEPKLGWFGRTMSIINWPFTKLGDAVLDTPGLGDILKKSFEGITSLCNDLAQWSVNKEAIFAEFRRYDHKVKSHRDILRLKLEHVDKVVGWLAAKYKGIALGEGAVTGSIGLVGIPADLLALIALNLRAIGEYATYYGFDIKRQEERLFAMNILGLASSPTDSSKTLAMAQLINISQNVAKKKTWKDLEKHAFVKVVSQISKALNIRLTKAKLAQVIPIAGAAIGGGFNAYFTSKVCDSAYFLYRERFLAKKYGPNVIEVTVEPADSFDPQFPEETESIP